jgi:outer membrane protein
MALKTRTEFNRRVIMKTIRCLLAVLFLFTLPTMAHAIGLEVAIGGGKQSPSGNFGYQPASPGDLLDLERDAGYDDETRLYGRAKIELPLLLNIYLMATPVKFEEMGERAIPFAFGDETFSGEFSSKLVLDHYDIALYYGIPLLGVATLNTLNVELGINLRIIDASLEVNQEETGISESRSVILPVPMLYLGAQLKPVKWLALETEVRGTAYSGNRFLDLIGRVKVKPLGPVFIAAGWRQQDIKVDARDIEADITLKGPFAELGFAF